MGYRGPCPGGNAATTCAEGLARGAGHPGLVTRGAREKPMSGPVKVAVAGAVGRLLEPGRGARPFPRAPLGAHGNHADLLAADRQHWRLHARRGGSPPAACVNSGPTGKA